LVLDDSTEAVMSVSSGWPISIDICCRAAEAALFDSEVRSRVMRSLTVAPSVEDSDGSMSDLRSRRKARCRVWEAADDAYPWIKHTLASYTPIFDVHNGCLCSFAYHSFPKALLDQDLFKTVHAIIFLSNMDLGQVYVTAAHTDSVVRTFVFKEVRDEPGVYTFQS
jgi:hypothetical protein